MVFIMSFREINKDLDCTKFITKRDMVLFNNMQIV